MWNEFYNEAEAELRFGGKLYHFTDWGSKLPGAVARISGLLHMSRYGHKSERTPIDSDTMNGAIAIGRYYMEHAIVTFELMGENPCIELAKRILEFIKRNDVNQFKGRDVLRHTGIRTMKEVEQGLKVLHERCYIKEYSAEKNGKGRPEGATYLVNPLCKAD